MEAFNTQTLAMTLALVGVVIVVAALLSGLIERSNLPQVGVFLALGAILGPYGLQLMNVTLQSPLLRMVATLSLALVLFTDAVGLDVREMRRHGGLALIVLGPGTMLSTLLIALAAMGILRLPWAAAAALAAALASTDPVLLRGLLRRPDLPRAASQALHLESGLNDVVLLPVVLVAMQFMAPAATHEGAQWARLALNLFLLGPGAGVLVGLVAVATLDLVRRRIGVRRDYESLYSLGVAFTAFAAAEVLHGSGFLAVFAAGLTIAALDVELCDCFLDYGASTAELALLFTFVLLGSSLIWSGLLALTPMTLLFALLTLAIRPVAFLTSFARSRIPKKDKLLIAWFGPRGLSSLLLILLPVFERTPGSERLFALCCLVVLCSITLHGGTLMTLGRFMDRKGNQRANPSAPESARSASEPAEEASRSAPSVPELERQAQESFAESAEETLLTIAQLRLLQEAGVPMQVLDVRSARTFNESDEIAEGALRVDPERPVQEVRRMGIPQDTWLPCYCT